MNPPSPKFGFEGVDLQSAKSKGEGRREQDARRMSMVAFLRERAWGDEGGWAHVALIIVLAQS